MPTSRKTGAPLNQINLVMPGSYGLNKQAETSILGPQWATSGKNAVFDTSGRMAARQGWLNQTTSPMSGTPKIEQIFELVKKDGTTQIVSAAGSKLWLGVNTPTDITGTATVTVGNNWQFVSYFGKLYGFQQGEQPIVYDGATSFADVTASSGTAPQGNCAVVHSGRIWAADSDKQTIKYSALLDGAAWATGAGNIDMSSVWPGGTDEIVAMSFYNGKMFVFGKNRIVIWTDPTGSVLGINPANMVVYDTVIGTGCIARDSIQQVEGGDIVFLSAQGLQSMTRLVIFKSNPLMNLSKNIRDYLNSNVSTADKSQIRSVYSPENSFYLLSIPSSMASFCFSTQFQNQDGSFRVTEWSGLVPPSCVRSLDGNVYLGFPGVGGNIGKYTGYQDNGGSYIFNYLSGWMDAGDDLNQFLKILKSITALLWVSSSADISVEWGFDFDPTLFSFALSLMNPGSSEWGIMEWGIDEWSGGVSLKDLIAPASGTGQFLRAGVTSVINGQAIALQQFNLFTKIGRMAR